jgi:hypothetical protein
MPKIQWEGNGDWEKSFPELPLPKNAKLLQRPADPVRGSTPYMILPGILCFAAVFVKARLAGTFLFDPWYAPLAFLVGFLVAMPLHEWLHGICYPREAVVYIGLRAYAVCFYPISKRRFILMSLAPAVPGILALAVFLLCPAGQKPLMSVYIVSAFMGLLSPAPDYMDVFLVAKSVPKGATIQASNQGLFWYP